MIAIRGDSKDIWIDHNEFHDCGGKCITSWANVTTGAAPDAPLPAPDRITISANIFRDTYFAILFGVAKDASRAQIPRFQRVTIYGNLFRDVHRRSPRAASFAWAHVFNNVIIDWGGCYNCGSAPGIDFAYAACRGRNYGFGSSAIGGAQLLAENNYYEARPGEEDCKIAISVDEYGKPGDNDYRGRGLVRASGNLAVNGAVLSENEPAKVFDPSDRGQPDAYYPYSLLAVDDVKAYVMSTAGPR